jgi:hypothetical protein
LVTEVVPGGIVPNNRKPKILLLNALSRVYTGLLIVEGVPPAQINTICTRRS